RWKMGQLKAGDRVRFVCFSETEAERAFATQNQILASVSAGRLGPSTVDPDDLTSPSAFAAVAEAAFFHPRAPTYSAILSEHEAEPGGERVVYRRDGDEYLLVEYGPPVLDLGLRMRAHALMTALEARKQKGIIDLTPGIRSLHVHYDPTV